MAVQRFDYINIHHTKVSRTPQGFIRVPANLTRTGVVEYKDTSGNKILELRHPDDVFHEDSLASLKGAPVTVGHRAMINSANVQALAVGYVHDDLSVSGSTVSGHLTIQEHNAISKVESKELIELSPGYLCTIDETPGVFEGSPYHRRQRNILYNHTALLEKGGGREGPDIAVRMDSDAWSDMNFEERDKMEKIVIRIDGVDYEIQVTPGLGATVKSAFSNAEQSRLDAKAALAKVEGEAAAIAEAKKKLEAEFALATDPAQIQARVDERAAVIEKATRLFPGLVAGGKTIDEIKIAALKGAGSTEARLDSANSDFIDGMFTAAEPPAGKFPFSLQKETRTDAVDAPVNADAARAEMILRNRNAWRKE